MQQEVSTDSDELTFGSFYKRARKGTDVDTVRAMPLAKTDTTRRAPLGVPHTTKRAPLGVPQHIQTFSFRKLGLALDAR